MTGYDRHYEKDEKGLYNHLTVHFHLDEGVATKEEINRRLVDLLTFKLIDEFIKEFKEKDADKKESDPQYTLVNLNCDICHQVISPGQLYYSYGACNMYVAHICCYLEKEKEI